MRIAVGGFNHETNTFSSCPVDRATLEENRLGASSYMKANQGVRADAGGYIDACRDLGIELIPTVQYTLLPCGPTIRGEFERCRDEIVELLWQAHLESPLDAIILKLHGGGAAEGYTDLEGEILRAVRARFGHEIPVGMSLDLHANYSQKMLDLCDVTVGYKCYPHVDGYECGYKLVQLLHQCVTGKKPAKAMVKLPMLLAPAYGLTTDGTAHDVQSLIYQMQKTEPGLMDISFFHGFAYADIPEAGASAVAMAADEETAKRCAQKLAAYVWSRRHDFKIPTHSAKQAMDLALEHEGVVVINESSDNPGGGAPGDGTHLLRELLERNIPGTAYGHIYDPEIVKLAMESGVGSRISGLLGAKTDNLHGTPIVLENAYVKTISDGVYKVKSSMGEGSVIDGKGFVLLQVGNVGIVVGGNRYQNKDDNPFLCVGIDWRQMRILAVKSSQHFKAWWAERADAIISCDSPGIHCADVAGFDFKCVPKTFFPFSDPQWK